MITKMEWGDVKYVACFMPKCLDCD